MDIRVLGFTVKMNKAGKPVEWVKYAPAHGITSMATNARVKDLIPPEQMEDDRDPQGTKMFHLRAVWSQIEPHYRAWKDGISMPETGTALSAWPGITEPEINAFNRAGIKSVEDVAGMSESVLAKVQLPNPRGLRDQARKFLELADRAGAEARIAELEAKLAALMEDKPKRGRPPKAKEPQDSEAA